MALNLLESTTELTNNNGFTAAAARLIGETPAATKSALGYMLPATIAGLAKQAETPEGASGMMETLASAPGVGELGDFATLGNRANTLVSWGASFSKRIFGDRTPPVANTVGQLSGAKPESVSTLFFVTLPMVLAFLKQHVAANGLDANGLRQVLNGQLKAVQPRLDPRVAGAVGVAPSATWEPSRETTRPPAPNISPVTTERPSGLRRLVPWAALAAAALLVFTLLRNRPSASPPPVTAVAPNTTAAMAPAAANTTATSPGDVAPAATATLPLAVTSTCPRLSCRRPISNHSPHSVKRSRRMERMSTSPATPTRPATMPQTSSWPRIERWRFAMRWRRRECKRRRSI